MAIPDLQDPGRRSTPPALDDAFRLHRFKCGRPLQAVCRVAAHRAGWELRLEIAGSLQISSVCRSREEVIDTTEHWRAAMLEKGWS